MGQTSNHEDWEQFFEEWGDRFLLFARQQTQSRADAEDVLQEAMVLVWSRRDRFPRIEAGLLFSQIRRTAIDRARREQRRRKREARFAGPGEEPFFDKRKPGLGLDVEKCLRQLPPEQQEAVVLKIWGELTFEGIGKALDISPNTAASRYRYGLEQLRRELTVEEEK